MLRTFQMSLVVHKTINYCLFLAMLDRWQDKTHKRLKYVFFYRAVSLTSGGDGDGGGGCC